MAVFGQPFFIAFGNYFLISGMKYLLLPLLLLSLIVQAQNVPSPKMYDLINRYNADVSMFSSKYPNKYGDPFLSVMEGLHSSYLKKMDAMDFNKLTYPEKIDFLLLKRAITKDADEQRELKQDLSAVQSSLKWNEIISDFDKERRVGKQPDALQLSKNLQRLADEIDNVKNSSVDYNAEQYRFLSQVTENLRSTLKNGTDFYNGYDPEFTKHATTSAKKADSALKDLSQFFSKKSESAKGSIDKSGIKGKRIGRDGLVKGFLYEMIPYSPDEVLKIADREFEWCEKEMLKASAAMGFGNDWKAALEKVKTLSVPEGKQPELVKFLADEAVDFIEKRKWLTIPEEAKAGWDMRMLSPEEQRFAPFFLGGRQILIAYPHSSMSPEDQRMSLRGNNRHFSRAVVFHELIPGHNLQYFMGNRYNPYRRGLGTPFWTEGWALYWEMLLYDNNFAVKPEDKVGMLFWRMHRCARIIFSIKYHSGEWTPQQCIDFLVDKVGHERANAEAEVRRSFEGNYGPLYQIAYMLGGLQFRALYKELVAAGKVPVKTFHDTILQEGSMPVELVRAILMKQPLTKNLKTTWRFAGELK